MKFAVIAGILAVLVAGGRVLAQHEHGAGHSQDAKQAESAQPAEKTIEGEFVDLVCYMGMKEHGASHVECGVACAKAGNPFGILTKDKKTYTLLVAAPSLSDQVGKTLRVTGKIMDGNMMLPSKMEAKTSGKWVEVKLPSMM